VSDIRYVLDKTQKVFDEEETRLRTLRPFATQGQVERMLEGGSKEVFPFLDGGLGRLDTMSREFSKDSHASHRGYFQAQLHPFFLLSPFVSRCFRKPLGYAGDFSMMDMIYRDPYEGVFAKFLNVYACHHISPARASRNRISYLLGHITAVARSITEQGQVPRIMSVGCGPANEVGAFLDSSDPSSDCVINLIDVEPEALYFLQESLLSKKVLRRHQAQMGIKHQSIKQLIQEARSVPTENSSYHLIYSAGLFEYLSSDTAKRLIEIFYERLRPGGRVVIGNFDPSNPFRCFMEYVAEWYLNYRSKDEMLGWAKDLPAAAVRCESEETGINNFLIVEKPI
jgi:extracellular factor (EF) 3-hydroxypalmitic acid methyl ester biosynthesis protein